MAAQWQFHMVQSLPWEFRLEMPVFFLPADVYCMLCTCWPPLVSFSAAFKSLQRASLFSFLFPPFPLLPFSLYPSLLPSFFGKYQWGAFEVQSTVLSAGYVGWTRAHPPRFWSLDMKAVLEG